ncbi:MAG TPA: hypothetical protein VK619_17325 [Pyrinomonadaceae bacterium]|nr:hypothetical protein [Pyrinomonadaceae bacterium]
MSISRTTEIMNRMLANVIGGRSRKPSLINAHVEPQMPQSSIQTIRGRALWYFAVLVDSAPL